jgi:hypothetical protein
VRFVYCACAVSALLNDWSGVNRNSCLQYILSCVTYEGGLSLVPGTVQQSRFVKQQMRIVQYSKVHYRSVQHNTVEQQTSLIQAMSLHTKVETSTWHLHISNRRHLGSVCSVLCCAVLCCAVLCSAMLRSALLYCALLCCTALCSTAPCYAVLCCTVPYYAVLCCTVLSCTVVCCVLRSIVLCRTPPNCTASYCATLRSAVLRSNAS